MHVSVFLYNFTPQCDLICGLIAGSSCPLDYYSLLPVALVHGATDDTGSHPMIYIYISKKKNLLLTFVDVNLQRS